MPKVTVDFAGPSYFGGKHDELVLCAGKGVFHILYRLPRDENSLCMQLGISTSGIVNQALYSIISDHKPSAAI